MTEQQAKPTDNGSEQALEVKVKLEGAKELEEALGRFNKTLEESVGKPKALLSQTEGSQKVEETKEVKEQKRLQKVCDWLNRNIGHYMSEDISSSVASGALGQVWQPDMIVLPLALPANLRRFVQVKEIPKGSKQVNFTTITTAAWASLTEDTAPSDATQTIAEISIAPTETGIKQRVSYITMESATPDVVEAVERSFQHGALLDEDNQIVTALETQNNSGSYKGSSTAGVIFANGTSGQYVANTPSTNNSGADSNIGSTYIFQAAYLNAALMLVQEQGYATNPGDLVCILHPVQYQDLLTDSHVNQYLYFGSIGPIQQGVVPQVYGIDIVRSTYIPTASGGGSPAATVYHAQVFLKTSFKGDQPAALGVGGSVGMGISRDLLVELWRRPDERDLWIIASHRIAVGMLQPLSIASIHSC
jgi:Phage capsid family